jgi:predicted unusual protein kinase regulating ubiquinone biosynthesis (AarF/ABC1/UbiB family)
LSRPLRHRWASSLSISPQQQPKNRQGVWWIVLGGGITGIVGTVFVVQYFHDHFGGREGLQRAVSFYSLAIPKYIQYRYHQMYQSDEQTWEELDRVTSQQGLDKILALKGFYVKCGQIAASNIGDAFPKIWQETMSVLQDRCPEEDYETVIRPILEAELNVDKVFRSIDPKPIGSASIGQVHRAVLHDGTPVVVKVCSGLL